MSRPTTEDFMRIGMTEEQARREVRTSEIVEKLLNDNSAMEAITAIVMAQDMNSAEYATERVAAGEKPQKVVWQIGSFARWDWALKNCPRWWVNRHCAELWRGSDPDDTDPAALKFWKRRGKHPVIDKDPLPDGKWFVVYRGQMPDALPGIAWSLNQDIADKFARGAGVRTKMPGVVLGGKVHRDTILAYITGRGEQEILVDPDWVFDVSVLTAYELVRKPETASP